MHIPVKPLLSWVVSATMLFGTAVDEILFSAAPGFEKGLDTSSKKDDTRPLFKLTSASSSTAS